MTVSIANELQSGRIGSCQSNKRLTRIGFLENFALNWSSVNFSDSGRISLFCLKIGKFDKRDSSLEAWWGRTVQKKSDK